MDYVNNKDFFELMKVRASQVAECKVKSAPLPKVSDDIGLIILKIATNLGNKGNFMNYTYKDEMIGDAIETCIRYIDNFDAEKGYNPFAYFTQICYYSFVRRINREKKQSDLKKKMVMRMCVDLDMFDAQAHDLNVPYRNTAIEFEMNNIDENSQ